MTSDAAHYDAIGWLAALVGAIGFGSFAVPIKGNAANSVDIDPLVMQSYKSLMCFLTSWLVVLLGQDITFTWWGIVSGLFWVPAGTFNIFAIRNVGMAISQAIVSSTIVMISFMWGHFVFDEPVKNEGIAYASVSLIMTGMCGMSYYATSESNGASSNHAEELEEEQNLMRIKSDSALLSLELDSPIERPINICGTSYSRRTLGLFSALGCGVWGGSCLVPMHYAKGNTGGLGYVISFSIGALVVTILFWLLRFGYQLCKLRSMKAAYAVLPPFHCRVMWLPGMTAGSLWSLGNVGSIVAVEHLGQGVGYSASQSALLISGAWGILFYKEVTKPPTILKWILSAVVTIFGILLLGYVSHTSEPG
ncbi:hypothetical protein ACHAXH_008819 [Discostella pseudostelligera]